MPFWRTTLPKKCQKHETTEPSDLSEDKTEQNQNKKPNKRPVKETEESPATHCKFSKAFQIVLLNRTGTDGIQSWNCGYC